jgi:NAD(P)-dependent dehydrogenase (short-subunit alcohol dehydrogenase family)
VAGYRRGLRLRGSVVVVTGASSGIGGATALALARAGAGAAAVGAARWPPRRLHPRTGAHPGG